MAFTYQLVLTPYSVLSVGVDLMRQSSKWRFQDEGSDSPVILGPMDREGVGHQVRLSRTP